MLERASVCIEPASYAFLRRAEAPIRSHRLLDTGFWRNGVSGQDVPLWWPLYLNKIRQIPQTQNKKERLGRGRDRQSDIFVAYSNRQSLPSVDSDYHPLNAGLTTRPFSQAAHHGNRQQQVYAESESFYHSERYDNDNNLLEPRQVDLRSKVRQEEQADDEFGDQDENGDNSHEGTTNVTVRSGTMARGARPQIRAEPEKQLHNFILDTDTTTSGYEARFKEAWSMFVRLPQQEGSASMMLAFLALSKDSVDLDRALRAYSIIPQDDRVKKDYDSGVSAAMKRRRTAAADQMCSEASNRNMAQDCRQTLLLSNIRRGLWQNVAQTWTTHFGDLSKAHSDRPAMTTIPDSMWSIIDVAVDLPLKLSVILRRLLDNDPTIADCIYPLRSVASSLLYRVFASPRIMGSITGKGILRLRQMSRQLHMFKLSYYTIALRTLHAMHETRNRADLALTIYRSMRQEFPDESIHRSVFGGLIESCIQAEYPEETLTFLLDEFATMHGKADERAYQRVMTGLAWQGDAPGVERIFKRFVDKHGVPKVLDYITPSLYVHARAGDVANTRARFNELQEKFGLPPNIYCWNILMYSYLRSQQPDEAFAVFEEAQQTGVKPDAHSFGTLMSMASEIGDTDKIHDLLDQAREARVPVSSAMLDTLVNSYCLNDEFEHALSIAEHATKNRIEGAVIRMWNILLRHCAFRADSVTMLRVQNRMRELGVKPDSMTYAALMTALIMLGRTKDAAAMLRALHTSEALTVTPFHYAIVLHGYAKEGNRDMVSVIYHELEHRFPQVIPGARMARLRVQAVRAISQRIGRVRHGTRSTLPSSKHAIDYLGEVLLATMEADKGRKQPTMGFGKQSGDPAVYVDYMIRYLASNKQTQQAQKLLDRYDSLSKWKFLRSNPVEQQGIQMMVTRLIVATQREQWTLVDSLWDDILQRAVEAASPFTKRIPIGKSIDATKISTDKPHMLEYLDAGKDPEPSGVAQQDLPSLPNLEHRSASILPARRFILSLPLNKYMLALDLQRRHSEMIDLVQKVQNIGFSLSSKNWNVYVQRLCKSSDKQHQTLAFQFFDAKFLPNTPDWKSLQAGKVSERTLTANTARGPLPVSQSRKIWERIKQDTAFPTYFTAVFLATRLAQFHRQAMQGDHSKLDMLRKRHAGTLNLLQQIPWSRDRVQGTLLRGRTLRGDPVKSEVKSNDRAGIMGSRSPLDHISHDQLVELEQLDADARLQDNVKSSGVDKAASSLRLAESITGEIARSPIYLADRGRLERPSEVSRRIDHEKDQKLFILENLYRDLNQQHLMADRRLGDASIGSSLKSTPTMKTPVDGALLNPQYRRLERSTGQPKKITLPSPLEPSVERRRRRSKYDTSDLARKIIPSKYRTKKSLQAFSKNQKFFAERKRFAAQEESAKEESTGEESDEPVEWRGFLSEANTSGTEGNKE